MYDKERVDEVKSKDIWGSGIHPNDFERFLAAHVITAVCSQGFARALTLLDYLLLQHCGCWTKPSQKTITDLSKSEQSSKQGY